MDSAPITLPPSERSPPGSQFKSDPEQPPLGIIHLMLWTACAAVCFSLASAFDLEFEPTDGVEGIVLPVAHGVGTSAALAGLLLAAARRRRGLPYPGQPGETLLLLLGVGAAMSMIQGVLLYAQGGPYMGSQGVLYSGFMCFHLLFLAVIYVIAAVRTKVPRWRWFFAARIVAPVLCTVLPTALFRFSTIHWYTILSCSPHVLLAAFLIGIAAKDFREHVSGRVRYRWTHWLGIAVQLWSSAVLTVRMIWWTLSQELP